MATTFCTNHIRQVGIGVAKLVRKHDQKGFHRGMEHLGMIVCFCVGAFLLSVFCKFMNEKSIWIALVPLLILFYRLAHADLTWEHDLIKQRNRLATKARRFFCLNCNYLDLFEIVVTINLHSVPFFLSDGRSPCHCLDAQIFLCPASLSHKAPYPVFYSLHESADPFVFFTPMLMPHDSKNSRFLVSQPGIAIACINGILATAASVLERPPGFVIHTSLAFR